MIQNKAHETFLQTAIKFRMQRIGDVFKYLDDCLGDKKEDKDELEYAVKLSSLNLYTILDKHDNTLLHLACREGMYN